MVPWASRIAQAESSKPGEAADGLAVMPTRQPLSSKTGEPRRVASKMAAGVAGTAAEAGFAGACGRENLLEKVEGWGFGAWATS